VEGRAASGVVHGRRGNIYATHSGEREMIGFDGGQKPDSSSWTIASYFSLSIPVRMCSPLTWSCTATVRIMRGVLSRPAYVRSMILSAGLTVGGHRVRQLRMVVC
jgi:hypothetical protein